MTPLISGLASLASLLFNASQSGAGKAAAPRRNGESADAGPAALVSWSPEARGLVGHGALGAESASALTRRVGRSAESASGTAFHFGHSCRGLGSRTKVRRPVRGLPGSQN